MMSKGLLLLVCFVAISYAQTVLLNTTTAAAINCATGCNWNTTYLFTTIDGAPPGAGDIVDLSFQPSTKISLSIDTEVSIARLDFGGYDNSYQYTLNILNGGSLTISGQLQFNKASTVIVQTGGTLTVAGQGTTNGLLTISGTVSFSGTKPSFTVISDITHQPLNIVTATLTLAGGLLNSPQGLSVGSTLLSGTLAGAGNITGDVTIGGKLKPGPDDDTTGNIWITGGLTLGSESTSTFNIKTKSDFDHVYLTGDLNADGDLRLSPIDSFTPPIAQRFYIMNHSGMIGGFDSVAGDGFSSLFNDKWTIRPDQENTIVVYDSATSIAISMGLIVACLVFAVTF